MGVGGISPIGYGAAFSFGAVSGGYGLGGSASIDPATGKKDVGGTDGTVRSVADAGQCQTCKERKYQDGSDEMVSFKSAAHISPQAAGAAVRAHEGEHVANAYKEAAKDENKEVVSTGVTIKTAVCPECGRTYVAGGETRTVMMTKSPAAKTNPYAKAAYENMGNALKGSRVDAAV